MSRFRLLIFSTEDWTIGKFLIPQNVGRLPLNPYFIELGKNLLASLKPEQGNEDDKYVGAINELVGIIH